MLATASGRRTTRGTDGVGPAGPDAPAAPGDNRLRGSGGPPKPRAEAEGPGLKIVRDRIIACELCPRLRMYCQRIGREKRRAFRGETYWARPVPGFGDPRARVLLIGLAPGAHGANRTGRVFTGDGVGGSGDFLMSALHRAGFANLPTSHHPDDGLTLSDAFIAAAVRCAPPDNKPTPEEIARCLPHLEAEIAALSHVRIVVALGRIGFDAYVRVLKQQGVIIGPRPAFGHARAHRLANGQTLVGCYHPSRQNTNTGKLTPHMMDDVFRVVRRALTP
ncbi:MAG TPA: uracil-DNA glycosylase [Vicinamibacterales bacterium]|nr:uracil-DNA glycosylase [Vicinamibacterales bacterium]